jgi:hypothetical protein
VALTAGQQYCLQRRAALPLETAVAAPPAAQFQLLLSEAALNSLLAAVRDAHLANLTTSVGDMITVCTSSQDPSSCVQVRCGKSSCIHFACRFAV